MASSSAAASVPGGVSELPAELTTLLHGDALSPGLLALGLLVAVGLGALHALTPGHGKTIMAAYLVGTRGDTRQAIGLGATVATSHTIGVLVLAMLVLAASSILPPERLFPGPERGLGDPGDRHRWLAAHRRMATHPFTPRAGASARACPR